MSQLVKLKITQTERIALAKSRIESRMGSYCSVYIIRCLYSMIALEIGSVAATQFTDTSVPDVGLRCAAVSTML